MENPFDLMLDKLNAVSERLATVEKILSTFVREKESIRTGEKNISKEEVEALMGISYSTIYRRMKDFPKPIESDYANSRKLWKLSDVMAYIEKMA